MRYEKFHAALKEIAQLHDVKGADYDGSNGSEYQNHRAILKWGIPAWKSPMLRIGEKLARIQVAAQNNTLKNESVEDSLQDIAVLSLIALVLYRDERAFAELNDDLDDMELPRIAAHDN